ncbi:MAG: RNA polymerase sigma factor [Bdellovibrionales bacterium]|nr:RNA polymerase sigma factor [Bdellovibrionales bacterium]
MAQSDNSQAPSSLETEFQSLVSRVRRGQTDAYDKLLHRISDIIRSFVKNRTSSHEISLEVTQEVLIAVHKALPSYQEHRSFSTWLFSIARYKLIDYWRKYEKDKKLVTLTDQEANSHEDDQQKVLLGELVEKMKELPADQMDVIYLSKVEGFSLQEIAEKKEQSVSWVKVNIHRGLKKLKRIVHGS